MGWYNDALELWYSKMMLWSYGVVHSSIFNLLELWANILDTTLLSIARGHGLVQWRRNSSDALELRLFSTKPWRRLQPQMSL